jgi:hypothetical protein
LLRENQAPKVIDYLSIDTEGSELEILQRFNFNEYIFNFITIEHNYRVERIALRDLLTQHGYIQILSQFSRYEDWFLFEENFEHFKELIDPGLG